MLNTRGEEPTFTKATVGEQMNPASLKLRWQADGRMKGSSDQYRVMCSAFVSNIAIQLAA